MAGGHAWWGVCMAGGIHGRGCAWQGACVEGGIHGGGMLGRGGHAWHMVNERAVRILLECILVESLFYVSFNHCRCMSDHESDN